MKLIIICVVGPGSTGKSSTIRKFTAKHLKYEKAKGDVLGIFPMPRLDYAVGVAGGGDTPGIILKGQKFLTGYRGLRVMIVASHLRGETIREVKRFAKKANAALHLIVTKKVPGTRERNLAIRTNVAEIRRLMPGRSP